MGVTARRRPVRRSAASSRPPSAVPAARSSLAPRRAPRVEGAAIGTAPSDRVAPYFLPAAVANGFTAARRPRPRVRASPHVRCNGPLVLAGRALITPLSGRGSVGRLAVLAVLHRLPSLLRGAGCERRRTVYKHHPRRRVPRNPASGTARHPANTGGAGSPGDVIAMVRTAGDAAPRRSLRWRTAAPAHSTWRSECGAAASWGRGSRVRSAAHRRRRPCWRLRPAPAARRPAPSRTPLRASAVA